MRYGIFSDVHASCEALEAVLVALKEDGADQLLCGGDLVNYGAEPEACAAKIQEVAHAVVAGNHDWAAVGKFSPEFFHEAAKVSLTWTIKKLSKSTKQYLKELPAVWKDEAVTLVHGALYEPEEFHYLLDIQGAEKHFEVQETPVSFVGHTHVPAILVKEASGQVRLLEETKVTLKEHAKYLVNVGSVGQPRDRTPEAAYGVYDTRLNELQIKRVPYDIGAVQKKIQSAGLPELFSNRLPKGS